LTDFGVPAIVGGNYRVLATDIYQYIIGQYNFSLGSVVAVLLLIPSLMIFCIDYLFFKKQKTTFMPHAIPYQPKPSMIKNSILFILSLIPALFIAMIFMAAFIGSFITYWPYNLTLTLSHYNFTHFDEAGWSSYINSLLLAFCVSCLGLFLISLTAYITTRIKSRGLITTLIHYVSSISIAIPGVVFGLSYIFFFSSFAPLFNFLYPGFLVLVINTLAHLYTTGYMLMRNHFGQIDESFEKVGYSLHGKMTKIIGKIILPLSLPALLNLGTYLFTNSMVTVSSVIFLYSAHTKLASIAIVNMNDTGYTSSAAAMSILIFLTVLCIVILKNILVKMIFAHAPWYQYNVKLIF
ncbi:MAG: putative 2-aminoethylphosphonate ABC transporter permease subunit, partial [Alphaproteobacteria bacterium]|nr:putative 2-aminoethylphosphonate ABC transporter permease subunit [Alphaproteobacteria bacterium]